MIMIYFLIGIGVVWYLTYQNCKNFVINLLSNPKKGFSKTPEDFKIPYEIIFLDTSDRVEISGWFIESVNQSDSAFIIMGDGFNTKSDLLEKSVFLSERFNLLYIDPRGVGTSKGRYRFGFDEYRDIEAAYIFLRDVKGIEKIYLYIVGFSFVSLFFLSDKIEIKGAIIKNPVQKPICEIERLINSKFKIMLCGSVIDKFFGIDVSSICFDAKKIRFPTIFITDKKIASSTSICVKNDDELRSAIYDFFRG